MLSAIFCAIGQLYAQTVITEPNPIERYETRYTHIDIQLKKIDTLLEDFHRYRPYDNWEVPYLSSNLGNVARPLFFKPLEYIGFQSGYNILDKYFLSTDSVRFYDTKTPFTSAAYIFGAKEEGLVDFTHSQNVTPQLNFAFNIQSPFSQGFYDRQKSGIKNIALSQWYQAPSKRYNLMAAYILNTAKIQENGGVAVEDIFTNPAYQQDLSTAPVRLYTAQNQLTDHHLLLYQTFYLGKSIATKDTTKKRSAILPKYGITHRFEYNTQKIKYRDDEDSSKTFYRDFFLENDTTRDFTKVQTIKNEIFIQNINETKDSSENSFAYNWKGGLRYAMNKYLQNTFSEWRHSLQFFGSFESNDRLKKKYSYRLDAAVDIAPKYSGDFITSANFNLHPNDFFSIEPFAVINTRSPSMKTEFLNTNHYQWENDFKKETVIHAGTKLGIPKWKLFFNLDYFLIKNYIYYNTDFHPTQLNNPLQIIRTTLEGNIYLKNFVFKNSATYQFVSQQDILHQPKFYLKHQWYYRGSYVKKKPLHAQLGFDLTYFGNFYADTYQPAFMEFALQDEDKLSFYPLIDIFFNLQIKRTRLFFVMQNISQGLLGKKGYYVAPDYPATPRALRLGVSWQFYD
ncbi:MAG: putative porin [Chitinophagales bacterium]|nr:putative porin [Chitinophagales bacterium]